MTAKWATFAGLDPRSSLEALRKLGAKHQAGIPIPLDSQV
jgi:hypothetical protein